MVIVIPLFNSKQLFDQAISSPQEGHTRVIDRKELKALALDIISKYIYKNYLAYPYECSTYMGGITMINMRDFKEALELDVDDALGGIKNIDYTKELLYYDCIITSDTIILSVDMI